MRLAHFDSSIQLNDRPMEEETKSQPGPLTAVQRRLMGVLMEKARTTPVSYPLSLNGVVTAANQKSNRYPVMNLEAEIVEDELTEMRKGGLVAEVHGGGRVAKYRHLGYVYLDVKGADAAIMTELLLRGEQTLGELRTRASRFEPIADLMTLQEHVDGLISRGLVVSLTPKGRGQMVTHNLYEDWELERVREKVGGQSALSGEPQASPKPASVSQSQSSSSQEFEELKQEVADLKLLVQSLGDRLDRLES